MHCCWLRSTYVCSLCHATLARSCTLSVRPMAASRRRLCSVLARTGQGPTAFRGLCWSGCAAGCAGGFSIRRGTTGMARGSAVARRRRSAFGAWMCPLPLAPHRRASAARAVPYEAALHARCASSKYDARHRTPSATAMHPAWPPVRHVLTLHSECTVQIAVRSAPIGPPRHFTQRKAHSGSGASQLSESHAYV